MFSWVNRVASHVSLAVLPCWLKSVFFQDETSSGVDPIHKPSITWEQKQFLDLALSFLPLAPMCVRLLVWSNITANQGYKNTEHSSLIWGIWGWSKSLLNKISKIEWDRIYLTLPFFFFFFQRKKSLTDSKILGSAITQATNTPVIQWVSGLQPHFK